jgi:hypothetical protein
MWRSWGTGLSDRPDLSQEDVETFGTRMWRGDFVVSVSRDFVRTSDTPLLVLPGTDRYHPGATGREIAGLAPAGRVFEPWNDSPQHVSQAVAAVRTFLQTHTPRDPA